MSDDRLWEGVREGCGTCHFSDGVNQFKMTECRRFPPTLMQVEQPNPGGAPYHVTQAERPQMMQDDWCGEYKRAT